MTLTLTLTVPPPGARTSSHAAGVTPVILHGDGEAGLWPVSRAAIPSPFQPILSQRTLLQQAVLRTAMPGARRPIVTCARRHRFLAADQLAAVGIEPAALVVEPEPCGPVPSATLAALIAAAEAPDTVLLMLSSDQIIADTAAFHDAADHAVRQAQRADRVMLGACAAAGPRRGPRFALGDESADAPGCHGVLRGGDWTWVFMATTAQTFLRELRAHRAGLVQGCEAALRQARRHDGVIELDATACASLPAVSLDEMLDAFRSEAQAVPIRSEACVVDSWAAVWQAAGGAGQGNVSVGDVVAEDTRACYLHSQSGLLVTLGVENLIVVGTGDVTLVAARDRADEVEAVVERLKRLNRPEVVDHAIVHRPWGNYRGVDAGTRYQVKHITVKPGGKLSLQRHHHRAEHWVVVSGTAKVTRGDDTFLVHENESVYMPMGCVHRLENPGKIDLDLIEVQTGGYLGEDDIVRFDDVYGRQAAE